MLILNKIKIVFKEIIKIKKHRNIFCYGKTLVIGDLGLAKSTESEASFAGTPIYSSPESILGREVGYFTDIW